MDLEAPAINCHPLHLLWRKGLFANVFDHSEDALMYTHSLAHCRSVCQVSSPFSLSTCSLHAVISHLPPGLGQLHSDIPAKTYWWHFSSAHQWMWFFQYHPQHMFLDFKFCFCLHIWLHMSGSDLTLSLRGNKTAIEVPWGRWLVFISWLSHSSNYVILRKLLNLSLSQFPQLQKGDNNISISESCEKEMNW